jgi:hypothetical protein
MAIKREKGVTLNSRGVYEIRLAGKYRGCRKTLKEANAFSQEIQNSLAIEYLKPDKKQSVVTGRKNKKTSTPKSKKITADTKQADCTNFVPPPKPASTEMVKRIETMPQKKESFWSKLKKAIFKD